MEPKELGRIAREVISLRRKMILLHVAIIGGAIALLYQVVQNSTLTHRSRFLVYWAGIFAAALVAFALSVKLRAAIRDLLQRAR